MTNKNFYLFFAIIDSALCAWNLISFKRNGDILSLVLCVVMGYLAWIQIKRYLEVDNNG